ncbi:acyl-CoA N-acyltransferase [Cyathus striatus]|nr:acyl-CoA N-acyltransferase [Cyathus striatus]
MRTSYLTSLVLLIVNKSTNTVIGDTGFQEINFETKSGELGIMIDSDPAIRGNGYALEILDLLFAFGFDTLGLERIVFGTNTENLPMRAVLDRKLGLEKIFREKEADWEYVADRAWWNKRKEGGVSVEVVEEVWEEA